MSQSSQKVTNNARALSNPYKIASLRSKLSDSPQLLQEFDAIVQTYNSSISANNKLIASLQFFIKTIITNIKQALSNPSTFLSTQQSWKYKEIQAAVLLESKMYQFNEIYQSIAANSFLIETLNLIKADKDGDVDATRLAIENSKKELLRFYKETTHYYRWKDKISGSKNKSWKQIQDLLKTNPELTLSSKIKSEAQQLAKNEEILQKIGLKFSEIQSKLLGFALSDNSINSMDQILMKLQKILTYIKESYQVKDCNKITPKTVKEHNEIIQILSLLSNSNIGLLQEMIDKQNNEQIKSASMKLLQNIIKNNRSSDSLYEFIIENTNQKVAYKFPRSVRHLPLERKLAQCERLAKQLKSNPKIFEQSLLETKTKSIISKELQQYNTAQANAILKMQAEMQGLKDKILESDQQLLLAEEEIYALSIEKQSITTKNKQLVAQTNRLTTQNQNLSDKCSALIFQKHQIQTKQTQLQEKYAEITGKNRSLMSQIESIRLNHNFISTQLLAKQDQILNITDKIIVLTNSLNEITTQKEEIINNISQKADNCKIYLNVIDIRIDPIPVESRNMEEVINFIQEVPLNMNNINLSQNQATPQTKKDRFAIKHTRSLSNVDFLSQLMPDMIEKDTQNDNLEGTIDSEQLKKGIQIRERTIKKYEAYMQKQRKEAKRHRSEILELEAKIRSLELDQIKLKQMIDDQSSERYLHFDDDGCGSIINIEDCTEKGEQVKSIEKIAQKEVQLKVKEEELNFKIEEIIKHVLKLNTLKVSPPTNGENENECIVEEFIQEPQFNPQHKNVQQIQ